MDLPLPLLDREVERAEAQARAAREALFREGPAGANAHFDANRIAYLKNTQNPLENARRVSSKASFEELTERSSGDPIAAGLRAWVYALTLERVLWNDTVRLAAAWHEETVELYEPEPARLSARSILTRLLAETSKGRRRAFASGLASGAGRVADAAHILAERRAEASRLLNVPNPDDLEIPLDPPSAVGSIADRLLAITDPFVRDATAGASSWDDVVARALARDASSGWPARLSPRWIQDHLRPSKLTEGLAIDLGPLPEPRGATSFALAFARFGRAFAEAALPHGAPFSLARPPFELRASRRSALFASLLADPVFGVYALGLSRDRAREQARSIARGLAVSLRLTAAKVRLRGSLNLPLARRRERLEEETHRALGSPIPGSLAGVVPSLSPRDPADLLGYILAARDRRDLIERFDEDWFRSPHAARALREEQAVLPASPRATEASVLEAMKDLERALEAVLV
ncbi:MAG: hypothetical protein L6Q76_11240 [Polyangiaceae bacterium]|nr:hypothetical protein [Polyangiaceae bacterium]